MFQHILLPTDGSAAAAAAAQFGLRFAAQVGARVTAVHVVEPLRLFTYEPIITDKALEAYGRNREEHARQCLDPIVQAAAASKVPCEVLTIEADDPYEGILNAARDHGCDLVMMASHGRKGVSRLLLGSQTQKVLTHSAIPVMVIRGGGTG
jgi:nucleotide-binding universal stress UspA family protein